MSGKSKAGKRKRGSQNGKKPKKPRKEAKKQKKQDANPTTEKITLWSGVQTTRGNMHMTCGSAAGEHRFPKGHVRSVKHSDGTEVEPKTLDADLVKELKDADVPMPDLPTKLKKTITLYDQNKQGLAHQFDFPAIQAALNTFGPPPGKRSPYRPFNVDKALSAAKKVQAAIDKHFGVVVTEKKEKKKKEEEEDDDESDDENDEQEEKPKPKPKPKETEQQRFGRFLADFSKNILDVYEERDDDPPTDKIFFSICAAFAKHFRPSLKQEAKTSKDNRAEVIAKWKGLFSRWICDVINSAPPPKLPANEGTETDAETGSDTDSNACSDAEMEPEEKKAVQKEKPKQTEKEKPKPKQKRLVCEDCQERAEAYPCKHCKKDCCEHEGASEIHCRDIAATEYACRDCKSAQTEKPKQTGNVKCVSDLCPTYPESEQLFYDKEKGGRKHCICNRREAEAKQKAEPQPQVAAVPVPVPVPLPVSAPATKPPTAAAKPQPQPPRPQPPQQQLHQPNSTTHVLKGGVWYPKEKEKTHYYLGGMWRSRNTCSICNMPDLSASSSQYKKCRELRCNEYFCAACEKKHTRLVRSAMYCLKCADAVPPPRPCSFCKNESKRSCRMSVKCQKHFCADCEKAHGRLIESYKLYCVDCAKAFPGSAAVAVPEPASIPAAVAAPEPEKAA